MDVRISNLIFVLTLIAPGFSTDPGSPTKNIGTSSDTGNKIKPTECKTTALPLPEPSHQIKLPGSRNSASLPSSCYPPTGYFQQLPQPPVQTPPLVSQNKPSKLKNAALPLPHFFQSSDNSQKLLQPPIQTSPLFQQSKPPESRNSAPSRSKFGSSADYPHQQRPLSAQTPLPQLLTRNESPGSRNPTRSQSDFHQLNSFQPVPLPIRQEPIPATRTPSIPPKQNGIMRLNAFKYDDESDLEQKIELPSSPTKQSTLEFGSSTSKNTKPPIENLVPPIVSAVQPPLETHKHRKLFPQQTFNHAQSPETQMEMPSNFKLREYEVHHNAESPVFPVYSSTSAQSIGVSTGTKLPEQQGSQQPSRQQAHPLPRPPCIKLKVINCTIQKKECDRIFHEYIEYMKIFARRNMENKNMWKLIMNDKINWEILLTKLVGDKVEKLRYGEKEIDISIVRGTEEQHTSTGTLRARPFVLKKHHLVTNDYNDFIGLVPGTVFHPAEATILVLYSRIRSKINSQIPFTFNDSEILSMPQLLYVLEDPTIQKLQNFSSK